MKSPRRGPNLPVYKGKDPDETGKILCSFHPDFVRELNLFLKNQNQYSSRTEFIREAVREHYNKVKATLKSIPQAVSCKLSREDVMEIRASDQPVKMIAAKYKVSTRTIYNIRKGLTRK